MQGCRNAVDHCTVDDVGTGQCFTCGQQYCGPCRSVLTEQTMGQRGGSGDLGARATCAVEACGASLLGRRYQQLSGYWNLSVGGSCLGSMRVPSSWKDQHHAVRIGLPPHVAQRARAQDWVQPRIASGA